MEQHEIRLEAVFRQTLAMYQPGKAGHELRPGTHLNGWDWGQGIALYGLHKAYPYLGSLAQQAYFDFWPGWIETWLDRASPGPAINSAILLNVLWLALHDPAMPLAQPQREFYRDYVRERVQFYRQQAHRTPSGAFAHTVATGSPDSFRQIWADNLFMLVLLLAQVAATDREVILFGEMVDQLERHYAHLSDSATHLLYHGWQFDPTGPELDRAGFRGTHLNGANWGRGNGWAALGVTALLELTRQPGFEAFGPRIQAIARPHFEGLRACQQSDGSWNTLLGQAESQPETSATAGIALAFLAGSRQGWLGPEFRLAGHKAVKAVAGQIGPEGVVQGVSGSTPLLPNLPAYNAVPTLAPATWGQGMALLALSEARKGDRETEQNEGV